MIRKKLRSLVTEYSERNKGCNCADVYSVTNSQGFVPSTDYFSKEVFSKDLSTYKVVRNGMIAYNPSRINVGSVAVQRAAEKVIVSPLYVVFSVNETELLPEFLVYYLHSDAGLQQIVAHTSGSVRDSLKFTALQDIEINQFSVEQQKEIIAKLQKLESVIKKERAVLQKFDDLIKSKFASLFRNKGYSYVPLIDLIMEGAGLSYGIVQPGEDGTGDMGVLRPVDIENGSVSENSIKYIDRSIGSPYKRTELTGDELLITVRGTTGITALTDARFKGMNVTRGIAVIRYDRNKIDPIFLNAYLGTDESQRYIQEHTRGATLQQINMSDLRIQKIMMPPMKIQKEFASFIEQTEKIKNKSKHNLEQLEICYKALLQKYFG